MVEPNGKEEQGRHNLLGAAALSWLISVFLFASPSYLSIAGGTAAVLNVLAIIAIAFSLYATGYTVDELAFWVRLHICFHRDRHRNPCCSKPATPT